jgi:integrase/recombinase XerD
LPRETPREREHCFRTGWLFTLHYLCSLRISEIFYKQIGSFFCRHDKGGEDRWQLEVLGKGDKLRIACDQ